MRRGRNEVETCALNGWTVGTLLRGHEGWSNGKGYWTTMRITAIGEQSVLGRCIRHESTDAGEITDVVACHHRENTWTLRYREWTTTEPTPDAPPHPASRESEQAAAGAGS